MKKIIINDKDRFFDQPITVRIWENDILMNCNHAGAEEDQDEMGNNGAMVNILACDKCPAFQLEHEDFWYGEDEVIEREESDVA